MSREERKKEFIRRLAKFCVGNQAGKSILLEMETRVPKPSPMPSLAKEWATLRHATPLQGYPTYDEAVKVLGEFLA